MSKLYRWFLVKLGLANKSVRSLDNYQSWYGRVNYWRLKKSLLKKECKLMVKYGVSGYMIEMASESEGSGTGFNDKWLKDVEDNYKYLLNQCRLRGLWLFVSVINDNLGKKGGRRLVHVWNSAIKLLDIIKKYGPDNVIVQDVAETQTDAGKKYEQLGLKTLPNFIHVYNGSVGSPSGPAAGFQFYAVHPSSIGRKNPSNAFIISDHSLIIKELANGTFDGPANIDQLRRWINIVRSNNNKVIGYYAYLVKNLDKECVRYLGTYK